MVVRFSDYASACLYFQGDSRCAFLLKSQSAAGTFQSIEESSDLIRNGTSAPPACGIVPQPITLSSRSIQQVSKIVCSLQLCDRNSTNVSQFPFVLHVPPIPYHIYHCDDNENEILMNLYDSLVSGKYMRRTRPEPVWAISVEGHPISREYMIRYAS
jgi:hypothetical protein